MSAEDKPEGASESQIAANRANAKRSTGPKTTDGKTRSSQNARKHGGYAAPVAIEKGEFAEDPDEIEALKQAVVGDLAPRDTIELVAANRIAALIVQQDRVTRYNAAYCGEITDVELLDTISHNPSGLTDRDAQSIAIRKLYAGPLDTTTVLDARMNRELQRAYAVYAQLRKRDLEGAANAG